MDIISFMIVVWFVKVLAEDANSAIKGAPNPRLARRAARQRSRSNNRIWGAFTNYLGDVAEDARDQAAERRRRKHETADQERESAPKPIDDRGWEGYNQDPADPSVVDVGTPSPREPVDLPLDDPQTPDPEKTDSPPDPEPEPEPIPAEPTDDERPLAPVIPMFPTKEDLPMTAPTGEAPGLVHAIGFTEAMQSTYANFAATGDTFLASLANGEVSGEAVAAAQEARDHEAAAAAAWGRCAGALNDQVRGKEFYNSTPGAGTRDWLVNE